MANNATYYSLIHIIFLISLRLGKPWKKQATVMPIITSLKEGLSLSETFLEFLRAWTIGNILRFAICVTQAARDGRL